MWVWGLIFLILALLMIPVGIYLNIYLKRTISFFGADIKKKYLRRLILIISIILTIFCINIWSTVALVLFHILVISLIMELINKTKKKVDRKRGIDYDKTIWSKIYKSGLLPILITIIILCIGFYKMEHVVETDYIVQTEKNIQTQGYRVAMISDLHYGTIVHKKQLEKVCKRIEDTNPDMIVLCGDIVEESTTLEEMKEAMALLGNMHSKYGVFYVYGNHDLSTYSLKPNYTKEQLNQALTTNNIHILSDDAVTINNDFVMIGRSDAGFRMNANRKSGQDLLQNVDRNKFILLLDHQPLDLKENSKLGFDLQLSGHTHAGQIWPAGVLNQLFGFVDLNYGSKKFDHFEAIVSSGIAGWGYPIRTEANCEYVIIDIK